MCLGSLRECLKKTNEFKSLGNDRVSVEINMMKRVISICGEQSAAKDCENHVRALLTSLSQSITKNNTASGNDGDCPICFAPCESPYALQQCGHTYCRACLLDFFTSKCSPTLSMSTFKICCPVAGCNASCLIRDIKSILGTDKMERLVKVAFQIYLQQKGADLATCFGIDCPQVDYWNNLSDISSIVS